tara:strand:- start:376 stop:1044 length:669 start_codon:yes stop_codon:yes gene_type:complete
MTSLLTRCREYESKFPTVPVDWIHFKQYAVPLEFAKKLEVFWSFGVSKEILFEENIRKNNANAKIYTCDPTPMALKTVAKSPARVEHTNKAYDPTERTMTFYTTDHKKRCWSLENIDPENLVDSIQVETENLKSISQRLGSKVDLIKLDIEGRWNELCSEILQLDLPVQMVHVEFEMIFGPADQEFQKLDTIVKGFENKGFKIWTNRILQNTNIELCFDRHE